MRNSIETSFKLKSADETGRITGYASVFSVEDRHVSPACPGAEVTSLKSEESSELAEAIRQFVDACKK